MDVKGWVRTSLIDYPARIATVLFTGGCNFRCPMCHNADLVLRYQTLPAVPDTAIWDFLARREGLIDGVVLTGGEPTLQDDIIDFAGDVQARGFDVKLDTNGYRPEVLEALLSAGVVDFVAMDVKAPPEKLPLLTGREDVDPERIERSVSLLQASGIPYEIRTTVVPGRLADEDVEGIARWIAGTERYVLQQFRPAQTLDPALEELTPAPVSALQRMAGRASRWVGEAIVR